MAENDLLDHATLVATTDIGPVDALGQRIWSVPWIVIDGKPAATDPIEGDELEEILVQGRGREPLSVEEAFMETVLHSAYATALAYLHGSLQPVLDTALASAAVRSPLTRINPEMVIDIVKANKEGLYSSWEDKLMRALAVSYVRELWWASNGFLERSQVEDNATPLQVAQWLLAKASIGRNGLPLKPFPDRDRVQKLASFIRRGAAGLLNKVRHEQEKILGDKDYWRLLSKKLGRAQ